MNVNAVNYDPAASCEGICYFNCSADLDGDGQVGINDVSLLLAIMGCVDCSQYDLDGSGAVDVMDLLTVISEFGFNCQ